MIIGIVASIRRSTVPASAGNIISPLGGTLLGFDNTFGIERTRNVYYSGIRFNTNRFGYGTP